MKKYGLIICFTLILAGNAFSQINTDSDNWKNKWLYVSAWAGYGSGFSMGICADIQLSNHFSLGIEPGLVDRNYPALSVLPQFNFRPGNAEISLYGGLSFGYSSAYKFIWGVNFGLDAGYRVGPGILFITARNGMGWDVGIGYKMGFLDKLL